jgi:hypothetical protein
MGEHPKTYAYPVLKDLTAEAISTELLLKGAKAYLTAKSRNRFARPKPD